MKQELTAQEEKLMNEVRDEWINHAMSCYEIDEQQLEEAYEFLYSLINKPKPRIELLDSPKQVLERLSELKVDRGLSNCFDLSDFGWVSFYDFFKRIGIVKNEKFDKYMNFLKNSPFLNVQLETAVIASKQPVFINRDGQGRLNCTTTHAIEFSDGYGQHYVSGVFFTPEEFEKFVLGKPSGSDIVALENVDKKSVLFDLYGYDHVFESLPNKRVIDEYSHKWNGGEKVVEYVLFEYDIGENVRQRCVKVEWFEADGKHTSVLGVPVEFCTCRSAVAWTFSMGEEEYWSGLVHES